MASTTIGQVLIELQANTASFAADMNKARRILTDQVGGMRRSLEGISSGFDAVRSRLGMLTGALGAFGAAAALRSSLKIVSDLGELGEQAGVSAGQLFALTLAGNANNLSSEQLQGNIEKLTRKIGEAARGTTDAVATFDGLGIAILNVDGTARPTIEILKQVANVIQGTSDAATQARIAFDVFGKAGQKMIPLLAKGAKGIDEALGSVKVKDVNELSQEFDQLFDKAADNSKRFAMEIAKVVSEIRKLAGDKALLSAVLGGSGAVVGSFAGPVGAVLGAGAGVIAGQILGADKGVDEIRKKIEAAENQAAFLQERLAGVSSSQNPALQRTLDGWKKKLEEVNLEAADLRHKLDEIQGLSIQGPTFTSLGMQDLPALRAVGDDEIQRLQQQRALISQLNASKQSFNRPDNVGLGLNLKNQVDVKRMNDEQMKALKDQGVQFDVLSEATANYGKRLAGDTLVSVRKFTDAQVGQAVAIQKSVDGMKQGEIARGIFSLIPQVEAAKKATVEFNSLTGAYEINTTTLDALRKSQELNTGATAFGASRAAELAKIFVGSQEEIKKAMEAAGQQQRLAQTRRDVPRQTSDLLAQAVAAKKATIDLDALTGTYRVNSRELEIVRKEQELLNQTLGLSVEEARKLATAYVDAGEGLKRVADGQEEQTRRLNDAAGDFTRVIGTAFEDAVIKGGKFREVLAGLAQDIARIALRMSVTKPMETAMSGLFGGLFSSLFGGGSSAFAALPGAAQGGGRASGGPVSAGTGYMVGERGPEFFVPNTNGTIIPNGAGGGTINIAPVINVSGGGGDTSNAAAVGSSVAAALRDLVQDQIRRAMRPGGMIYGAR